MTTIDESIEASWEVIKAARRHIASFEPRTLFGSELNLARALYDLDGEMWKEWIIPGIPGEDAE